MPQMRHGPTAGGHSVWFDATHDQQPPPHRDYGGAYARRDGGSDDDTALNGAALTGALPREHIGDLEKAHGCWAAELDGGSAAPAN